MRQLLSERNAVLQSQQQESGIATSKIKQAKAQPASPAPKYRGGCVDKEFQPKQFYFSMHKRLKQTFVIEAVDCFNHRCNCQPTHNK